MAFRKAAAFPWSAKGRLSPSSPLPSRWLFEMRQHFLGVRKAGFRLLLRSRHDGFSKSGSISLECESSVFAFFSAPGTMAFRNAAAFPKSHRDGSGEEGESRPFALQGNAAAFRKAIVPGAEKKAKTELSHSKEMLPHFEKPSCRERRRRRKLNFRILRKCCRFSKSHHAGSGEEGESRPFALQGNAAAFRKAIVPGAEKKAKTELSHSKEMLPHFLECERPAFAFFSAPGTMAFRNAAAFPWSAKGRLSPSSSLQA